MSINSSNISFNVEINPATFILPEEFIVTSPNNPCKEAAHELYNFIVANKLAI